MPGYIDDFIIGGLRMFAARAAQQGQRHGRGLLIAAWGILYGGLWGSLFGQISNTSPQDISGLPNMPFVTLKLLVYGIAISGLVLSIRRSKD